MGRKAPTKWREGGSGIVSENGGKVGQGPAFGEEETRVTVRSTVSINSAFVPHRYYHDIFSCLGLWGFFIALRRNR